jgi:hypothetical protein
LFPTRAQSASSAEPSVQQLSLIRSPDVLTYFEKLGLEGSEECSPNGAGWMDHGVAIVGGIHPENADVFPLPCASADRIVAQSTATYKRDG